MNLNFFRNRRVRRVAGWAAGGVLAAGLLGGIADAATSAGPTTPSTSAAATTSVTAARNASGLLRRAVRGQITLRTRHGYLTVEFQRGVVTAVNGSEVTVRDVEGHSTSYLLGSTTKVRRLGITASPSAIQVGDRVLVIADGTAPTALRIRDNGPAGTRTGQQSSPSPAATA